MSAELIRGNNDRVIGHACDKCGLMYTTKQYKDDHQQRAEACCAETPCPECKKQKEKYHLICFGCMRRKHYEAFAAKPESPWDGNFPVVLFNSDRYFFSAEELDDYLLDMEADDLPEIEACDKVVHRSFHVAEFIEWDSDHGDIDDEHVIDDYVNEWIKKNVPPTYTGNGQRITSQVLQGVTTGAKP